jgi:phage replication O-like protein O
MLENNYTQISNEFIEYMPKLSGSAVKVGLAIFRKTIGWRKKTDRVSYSQIQELTGLSINSLKKGIEELENVFITKLETKYGYRYDLNISENAISKIDTAISKNDTSLADLVSKIDTTKERYKKTNTKRNKRKPVSLNPPNVDDIRSYVTEKNLPIDPQVFYNYFDASGWRDKSGSLVYSWKQKLITWASYSNNQSTSVISSNYSDEEIAANKI